MIPMQNAGLFPIVFKSLGSDLFCTDALNWSKLTVNIHLHVQVFISKISSVLLNFLFIKESRDKRHGFHKNIKQLNVFNIDNK